MESFRKDEPKVKDVEIKSEKPKEDLPKIKPQLETPTKESHKEERNSRKDGKSPKKKNKCSVMFKKKPKEKHQDEIPLLNLQFSITTEEEDDDLESIGSTTTTSYIETELSQKTKRKAERKRPRVRRRVSETSSTETSYIDSPLTKSPKRNYMSDFELTSYDETPQKKMKLSTKVPENVPKLDLDFAYCDCDNPYCKHHPYICKALDKKVRYHTEIETSSGNNSIRSITFLSTTISEPLETSPSSETTTVSSSVRSSLPNKSSPHETINYLYDPESHSPDIDHNKPLSTAKSKQPTIKGKTSSSTTVSDVQVREKFKKKIHNYYKNTNYERGDNPKVKASKHQSKFAKFLNRLLRKVNIISILVVYS